jgi:hypothetical protein
MRLIEQGFLNTAPVHKQNENAYGQLFIDGPMLSLVRRQQSGRRSPRTAKQKQRTRVEKRSTPVRALVNTPGQKRSILRNSNPKTEIKKRDTLIARLKEGILARHGDGELRRIALRAAQIEEQTQLQAA